jgi:hypothetical protein
VKSLSADTAVTVTVSETPATDNWTLSGIDSATWTRMACSTVANPDSSKTTVYSPAGRNGRM